MQATTTHVDTTAAGATDRAWVATRKGLFEMRLAGAHWHIERHSFIGEPVSMVLPPRADGRMLAALNLGHFGVKLHASDDAGATWHEVATPVYPAQPEGAPGPAWKLVQIWSLEAAHGTVWAGTLPGGLFRSDDFGRSWQLVESLWNQPGRLGWFGGGYDVPGIHSICPHPQRPGEVLVGISCGGAWVTRDDGASWTLQASGMRAAYMPPDQADDGNTQDPHRIVRCAAAPRGAVVPASQRHLALHRQRRIMAGDHERAASRASASRWRSTRAIPTAPGSCRRRPTSAASRWTRRCSSPAPRTVRAASPPCARACPSAIATTSSTATGWRWPTTASGC